jgi:hypothetical protein
MDFPVSDSGYSTSESSITIDKMAKASMKFDYANAYGTRENQIPVFLRCQGVRGSLEVENSSPRSIDKVKIILKGKGSKTYQLRPNTN